MGVGYTHWIGSGARLMLAEYDAQTPQLASKP